MQDGQRRAAVARAVERIAELNLARDDDFQDAAMGEIRLAQDAFRAGTGAELPAPGSDPLLDALMEVTRSLDSSPETVATLCDAALEAAGVPLASEAGPTRERSR
jgi:hypothetical protein